MRKLFPAVRKSFRRTIEKTIEKALSLPTESSRQEFYPAIINIGYIGEHCEKIGITRMKLFEILDVEPAESITNGIVLELARLKTSEKLTIDHMFLFMDRLLPNTFVDNESLKN